MQKTKIQKHFSELKMKFTKDKKLPKIMITEEYKNISINSKDKGTKG